jgi:hypothetical protein
VTRWAAAASFTLVVVLAVELAVWGCFLVAARPFGVGLPVAAVVALVGNLGLGVVGARILQRVVGAVVPGALWLVIVLRLASRTNEGDTLVPASLRGYAFLGVGAVAAAVAVGLAMGTRATPRGPDGR